MLAKIKKVYTGRGNSTTARVMFALLTALLFFAFSEYLSFLQKGYIYTIFAYITTNLFINFIVSKNKIRVDSAILRNVGICVIIVMIAALVMM